MLERKPVIGLLYRAADALRRRSLRNDHGRLGEDYAHRYLRGHGCTIVARNYRTRSGSGEIDIVAWHGATLAFVEVKTRVGTEPVPLYLTPKAFLGLGSDQATSA